MQYDNNFSYLVDNNKNQTLMFEQWSINQKW